MSKPSRFQPRKATHGGWYVLDCQTGRMWPGMARVGAIQLAGHLNRRAV